MDPFDQAIDRLKEARPGDAGGSESMLSASQEDLLLGQILSDVRNPGAIDNRGRRRKRARLIYVIPTIAAAAVVALVVSTILPTGAGGPTGAAAAQLDRLATVAAIQPTPVLQPGQYYNQVWSESATSSQAFTRTASAQSLTPGPSSPSSTPSGAQSASSSSAQTVHYAHTTILKTWVASNGIGTCTNTPGTLTFATAADQANWESLGSPGIGYVSLSMVSPHEPVPPGLLTRSLYVCPPSATSTGGQGGSGVALQLFDVSGLPTDPVSLGTLIADRQTGLTSIDAEAPGEANTFAAVAQLLAGPDQGATPAFRSALYRVLAGLPGVTVSGSVTDSTGRSGLEVALTTSAPSSSTAMLRETAIVDPNTADLLDWNISVLGAGSSTAQEPYAPGDGMSFSLVSSGIVDSTSTTASG
jgi:hypothetical protein